MKVFVDTNVILDVLLDRDGADITEKAIGIEGITFMISASSVTDIYYIMRRKKKSKKDAENGIKDLREVFDIIDTTAKDVESAINLGWNDFEDAVQYSSALANKADIIMTNNKKDFSKSTIPAMTPKDLYDSYGP